MVQEIHPTCGVGVQEIHPESGEATLGRTPGNYRSSGWKFKVLTGVQPTMDVECFQWQIGPDGTCCVLPGD